MIQFLKSVLDQDHMPVVLCDINHKIVYMNRSSIIKYQKDLTGQCIFDCHDEESKRKMNEVISWFKKSKDNNVIHTFYNVEDNRDVYMIALRDDEENLIGYYERHIERNPDKEKLYNFK